LDLSGWSAGWHTFYLYIAATPARALVIATPTDISESARQRRLHAGSLASTAPHPLRVVLLTLLPAVTSPAIEAHPGSAKDEVRIIARRFSGVPYWLVVARIARLTIWRWILAAITAVSATRDKIDLTRVKFTHEDVPSLYYKGKQS